MKLYQYILIINLLLPFLGTAQCNLTASSSGGNATYTQVYVLVDANTGLIVAENGTGSFSAVAEGTYQIHALNYNPADAPAPLPSALIGQSINLVGSTTAGCFNADFLTDFITRACSSCSISRTICESDPFVVSSSGAMLGYTQLYVLVDAATGLIVTTATNGIFTGTVSAGNSYQVYALNFDPANPPNPLPTPGQLVTACGSITQGCKNSDYLTDYICYNVTPCGTTCLRTTILCQGTNISVSTSGENEAYTRVFVLADAAGNFIAQNNTGIFPTGALADGDYQVHALNFNPADAPTPLPSGLSVGNPISSIAGGCFNNDFLTDFLCFTVDCTLLDNNLLNFNGRKSGPDNILNWVMDNESDLKGYQLERSPNGYSDFQSLTYISADGSANYNFVDELPFASSYYRLRLLHSDNNFEFSKAIHIQQAQTNGDIRIYPNPAKHSLNIDILDYTGTGISIRLLNVLGQEVKSAFYNLEEGKNRLTLNLEELSAAVYIIQLKAGAWQWTSRFVKE
jgi:hypothetical protein